MSYREQGGAHVRLHVLIIQRHDLHQVLQGRHAHLKQHTEQQVSACEGSKVTGVTLALLTLVSGHCVASQTTCMMKCRSV